MVSTRAATRYTTTTHIRYYRNLQESYQLLKPIADVLSTRYGAVVSIFMAAPHQSGEIETQTCVPLIKFLSVLANI